MNCSNNNSKLLGFVAGALLGLTVAAPALADDTEIFVSEITGFDNTAPNVLFIIDTSGSMDGLVGQMPQYDPAVTYAGSCAVDRTYWRAGAGPLPEDICTAGSATSEQWFSSDALKCAAIGTQMTNNGKSGLNFLARFDPLLNGGSWDLLSTDITARDQAVECSTDSGVHGDGVDATSLWAADAPAGPWSANDADEVAWGVGKTGQQYILFTGNYVNWSLGPDGQDNRPSRLDVVKQVTNALLDNTENINVGLMRFSNNGGPDDELAEGGMVLFDMAPISTSRDQMKTIIDNLGADGFTPLTETMYEAGQYYHGRNVYYGLDSVGNDGVTPEPSVAESREGPNLELYDSPADGLSCRKNFIVLLTDGEPTADNGANGLIPSLPGFEDATGNNNCTGSGDGRCLDDMAAYLYNRDLDNDVDDGVQNVITYTIGFAVDFPLLQSTAERGGGDYFTAGDVAGLEAAFDTIIGDVSSGSSAFAVPAAAVNSFNRTQNLNELFFAVFRPASTPHWDGNLKKYRFEGGQILGVDDSFSAVDPDTGFFRESSQSLWSQDVDGADARKGGAANILPDPALRKVYTYTGSEDLLSAASNRLVTENAAVTEASLGIGGPGDPDRATLIDWARGQDVLDQDGDGNTVEARNVMGDPLHSTPVVVVYGGTPGTPDLSDAVVYVTTNDGYLHAFDADTGEERFAFVPRELLTNLPRIFDNTDSAGKAYGADGPIQVLRQDVNGDGVIETGAGDRIVLYFGMRRGGTNYYAVDVSDPDSPTLLWTAGAAELPRVGQTWSPPILTQVAVDGVDQNDENTVLVVGGGYPVAGNQDNPGYSVDGTGNAIFMIDAMTGALLWSAGPTAEHNLQLAQMTNAIPSTVRVIDLNNDNFADRMYVGDMGGRVWRFDIFNGQNQNNLVAGGVIASLGAADLDAPTVADNRRFYNAPDVALVPRETDSYLNIAIGSGYRAHPLNMQTDDRFYGLRDYNVFQQLDQLAYNAISADPIVDNDPQLVDVTNDVSPVIPEGALGWKLSLPGEKVLSESRTFDGTIIFTTFTPVAGSSACVPGRGLNKLYQVNIADASPVTNLDGIGDGEALTITDRSRDLAQTGIAPTPTFLFPPSGDNVGTDGDETCEDGNCTCEGDDCGILPPRCLVGLEACDVDFGNPPVRTFWTQRDVDPD